MAADLNFRNHQFELAADQSGLFNVECFICLKCKVKMHFIEAFEFTKYHFRPIRERNILKQLTCEEIQIKKLLE
jgi:hypothetical protein